MHTPARPTLRCLREDLESDWDSVDHQRMATDPEEFPVAVYEYEHRIVKKAAEDFPATGDSDVKRESISGLTDPVWWKVKIGARWRGAVFVDEEGQAWLCAAGYRREGEGSDFYKSFMANIRAVGSTKYLPTEADRGLLRAEVAEASFAKWECDLQRWACEWAHQTRREGIAGATLVDPDGDALAEVNLTFELVSDDSSDGGVAEFYIEFSCLDWSSADLLHWAESVVLAAINEKEQAWQVSYVKDARAYSLVLSQHEIDCLFDGMGNEGSPGICVPGDHSHYAHAARIVHGVVEGEAVKALCGRWFVPRQDHELLETCKQCEMILDHLPSN